MSPRIVIQNRASGEPDVRWDAEHRRYRVETEFRFLDAQNRRVVRIPQGFRCDLASIPRALWTIIDPRDLGERAPLIHDFLYFCGGDASWDERLSDGQVVHHHVVYTRKQADDLFRRDLFAQWVRPWKRRAAFVAVRLFGWKAWKG